ncbi:LysR family transcriptional regulator [Enterobacteriaceae bacterium H11S18]|uniref:LysR family transcriptional regulator n=1 Tax=Enterobacteriaceae TaxID=543 RepID=UPI001928A359|nr:MULTISPECIES: LysR family transcriptional regulator [Enterobacteriaceae]MCT4712222.1 LysR family transcriptional regulator [Dryocola clanedunensis]
MDNSDISMSNLKLVDALIEMKSAGRVARAFNVTDSSISYRLKQLRQMTGKQLFTRSRGELVPDKYAHELQEQYRKIAALSGQRREFIVTTYAPLEHLIVLQLNGVVGNDEDMYLQFASMSDFGNERLEKLKHRAVDIDIGGKLPDDNSIVCYPWLFSKVCALASSAHTTIKESLSLADWNENDHIGWTRGTDYIESAVSGDVQNEILSGRHIICESSNLLAMAHLCANSNSLMLVPEAFVAPLQILFPVKAWPLPEKLTLKFHCYIHYHREISQNPNTARILHLFDSTLP